MIKRLWANKKARYVLLGLGALLLVNASYHFVLWLRTLCWTPRTICVQSHYVQQTCTSVTTDGKGGTSVRTYECGHRVCDASVLNPEYDKDKRCTK